MMMDFSTATWLEVARVGVTLVCLGVNVGSLNSARRDRRMAMILSDEVLLVVATVALRREYLRCVKQCLVGATAVMALFVFSESSTLADSGVVVMTLVSIIIASEALLEHRDRRRIAVLDHGQGSRHSGLPSEDV